MSCSADPAAEDEHKVRAVAQHMENSPDTLAAHAGTVVYLAGHVAEETVRMLEKLIAECDNSPHWEVDTDSWLRSPCL
jgi:hypothetical protein